MRKRELLTEGAMMAVNGGMLHVFNDRQGALEFADSYDGDGMLSRITETTYNGRSVYMITIFN